METNIASLIDRMVADRKLVVRTSSRLSWGDHETCEALFRTLFRRLDGTIGTYRHLPEYDEVIDWMHDTRGVGMLLIGDCGRGKSIITTGLVPVLLLGMKGFSVYAVHADELNRPYPFAFSTMGMDPKTTCLDYLTRSPCPILDELGVEPMINDYGERYEGFNRIINAADRPLPCGKLRHSVRKTATSLRQIVIIRSECAVYRTNITLFFGTCKSFA